jgi:hypothetical protein
MKIRIMLIMLIMLSLIAQGCAYSGSTGVYYPQGGRHFSQTGDWLVDEAQATQKAIQGSEIYQEGLKNGTAEGRTTIRRRNTRGDKCVSDAWRFECRHFNTIQQMTETTAIIGF